jgi:hypothetical protein
MPPASYIICVVVLVGGGIASMAMTMGYSIFLIYWAFPIAAALIVTAASWRVVLSSGMPVWPAAIVTIASSAWLLGVFGGARGHMQLMRMASVIGAVSIAACGAAVWRMQEALDDEELTPGIYGVFFVLLGLIATLASGALVTLPTSVQTIMSDVFRALSLAGCCAVVLAIYRMVRCLDGEYWIAVAVLIPAALFASVLLSGRIAPEGAGRWAPGAMFVIFPFLALIGGMGCWRLSALVGDWFRRREIENLNAGRFAA